MIRKLRLLPFGYLLCFLIQAIPAWSQSSPPTTLQGSIAPNVSINVSSISNPNNSDFILAAVPMNGKSIRIELKGRGPAGQIPARLTVQLRSNVSYRLEAVVLEKTGNLTVAQFGLGNLAASGPRTAPAAVTSSQISGDFALSGEVPNGSLSQITEKPQIILSGPRISLGGGPLASTNALNVDLAVLVQAPPNQAWAIQLQLNATPAVETVTP